MVISLLKGGRRQAYGHGPSPGKPAEEGLSVLQRRGASRGGLRAGFVDHGVSEPGLPGP